MWVEDLKCMHYFWDVKKKKNYLMDVIFNIMQVKMGCVTFMSTQHDPFIKCVKWVGSGQLTLLTRSG